MKAGRELREIIIREIERIWLMDIREENDEDNCGAFTLEG